jgi:hypothetical protein
MTERTMTCCKRRCDRTDTGTPKAMTPAKQGKDTNAMLMVAPADANKDASAVRE